MNHDDTTTDTTSSNRGRSLIGYMRRGRSGEPGIGKEERERKRRETNRKSQQKAREEKATLITSLSQENRRLKELLNVQ